MSVAMTWTVAWCWELVGLALVADAVDEGEVDERAADDGEEGGRHG